MIVLAHDYKQVRVEADHTVYGDECKFGGGKVRSCSSLFPTKAPD